MNYTPKHRRKCASVLDRFRVMRNTELTDGQVRVLDEFFGKTDARVDDWYEAIRSVSDLKRGITFQDIEARAETRRRDRARYVQAAEKPDDVHAGPAGMPPLSSGAWDGVDGLILFSGRLSAADTEEELRSFSSALKRHVEGGKVPADAARTVYRAHLEHLRAHPMPAPYWPGWPKGVPRHPETEKDRERLAKQRAERKRIAKERVKLRLRRLEHAKHEIEKWKRSSIGE